MARTIEMRVNLIGASGSAKLDYPGPTRACYIHFRHELINMKI